MNLLTRILLAVLYLPITFAGIVGRLFGSDPLQLRPSRTRSSYWLVRAKAPQTAHYFSELSAVEGARTHHEGDERLLSPGITRILMPVFRAFARLYAPARSQPGEKFSAAADREQGIPDEVYTLW